MRIILVLLAALTLSTTAAAATAEEEVARYVQIFSGDIGAHSEAVETFAWMGLSDPRIFDVIEKRLLEERETARNNRDEKNRVARYIRALGFSGQAKYQPTISSLVADTVYGRYAQDALENMAEYRTWNPIISNRANFDPKLSDNANRVINMLRADDMMLKRIGAKRVYFGQREPAVVAALAQELKTHYPNAERRHADVIAWMVKGLGSAKDEQYRPLIEEIATGAGAGKLGTHARQALENYGEHSRYRR